jgi:hypothetical protein
MDNMLSAGGQLNFTDDPSGPTLTHLRQSWAATEVDLKLIEPATVGLTDNDRFHLLVRLKGGGAREQLGLLQETLLQEVKARNKPVQREYKRTLLTYQRELAAYEALTKEEQAAEEQLKPPAEPVLSDSFIQPVARFWKLLENLYPKRSTARILEFRDCQMKPGESMAKMVLRLQTMKLVLKQPEPCFANPKANRSEDRKCYLCNRPGHLARDCPQSKALGNRTTQMKGKPWCLYHKLNTHSSEACWALHPELRPSSKEKVAHSARPARVVPAKAGHSLNVKLRPTALSTKETIQPSVIQTMDSYYAEEVFDEDANDLAGLFITVAGAATKERRSAETHGLRCVTQADLPLSFLPHSDVPAATERLVPNPVPTPVVIENELGRFTPRQLYRAPRVGKVYGGKDMISEDLLDATDPDHDPSDKSDSLEMPEGFGYLSEGDPNFKEYWNL